MNKTISKFSKGGLFSFFILLLFFSITAEAQQGQEIEEFKDNIKELKQLNKKIENQDKKKKLNFT